MMKDITFGKFYNTRSFVHSLDGRTNLFRFIVFFVSLLIAKNPLCLLVAAIFLSIVLALSRIPVTVILKGVRGVSLYICLCFLLNLIADFSTEGFLRSLFFTGKIVMCVISASLFTLTTSISHISDTFEWVLSPLKIFKIEVRDLAVMLSMSIRFIPVLAQESNSIIQAQKARGLDLKKGSVFMKAKRLVPLIIPVFVSAIRRASDLSDALTVRGYGANDKRTRLHPLKFGKNDVYAVISNVLYLAIIILGNVYGC